MYYDENICIWNPSYRDKILLGQKCIINFKFKLNWACYHSSWLLWVALQSQTHFQPQEIQASCGSNIKGQHYNAPHLKQHRSPQVNRKAFLFC